MSPAAPRVRPVLTPLLVLGVYVAGVVTIRDTAHAHTVAAWWPAGGLGVVALLITPRRWLPQVAAACLVAYAAANITIGRPVVPSLFLGVADTLEIVVVVELLRRTGHERLTRVGDVWRLVLFALVGGLVAGFLIGTVAETMLAGDFTRSFLLSFPAHAASVVAIAPLAMVSWTSGPALRGGRLVELVVQTGLFAAVTLVVFAPQQAMLVGFAPLPFLIWAGFQFGPRVVVVEQICFGLLVAELTRLGGGPFAHHTNDPRVSALAAEIFLICVVLTGLPLAIAELERRTTLGRIGESEKVFRSNFEGSLVPMLLLRAADGQEPVVVRANPAARDVLGTADVAYVDHPVTDLLDTDPSIREICQAIVSGDSEGWSGRVQVHTRPDAQIVMSLSANTFDDDVEEQHLFSAHLVDLTDAHEARLRLQEQKEFSEAVLEITGSLVAVTDLTGTVLSVNPALTRATGFTSEELVGEKLWEKLRPEEERAKAVARFAPADETSVPANIELDVLTKDGGRRRMVLSNAVAHDSEGRPARIVMTAIDVTTEREAAGLITHLLRSATTTAFIGTDLVGTITLFNSGAEQLLGIDQAEARGRNVCAFLDPGELARHAVGDEPGFDSLVRRVRLSHTPETRDWQVQRADAPALHASMTTNEVADAFGQPIGFLFVLRDVTETRHSQEILVQALDREREAVRRLRVLDAAKDDFVSTVSHELRTPMTSIIGFAEMLEDGEVGDLDDRQLAVVEKISRNGERLLALADDLLGLAGFESGTHEPESVELDLREVARRGVAAVHDLLRNRDVKLQVEGDTEPVTVRGDGRHLERVLANLVGNAVKFTPDGGHVRVDVRRDREGAVVEVADTGIGIPADEVGAVFDKFFRSRNAEHHAIQGSGLGLAIVQAIVHGHHGSIEVTSVEGEGTTFTVRLPAATKTG